MAKKNGKRCECEQGAPMWVVTYGDMMSLLLTFFVLLLSFSTLDKPREFQEAIISIKGAFGVLPRNLTHIQINPVPIRIKRPNKETEDLARRIQRGLQVMGQEKDAKVTYDTAGGIKIDLPGEILFQAGQSQLRPDAYPMLANLGALLAELPGAFFEVRGHTDTTPVGGDAVFRDNYDLSFARADAVARFMSRSAEVGLDQFEIVACGAGQPVATNTTPEGRQANRRVEIYVRGPMDRQRVLQLQDRVKELTTPS